MRKREGLNASRPLCEGFQPARSCCACEDHGVIALAVLAVMMYKRMTVHYSYS